MLQIPLEFEVGWTFQLLDECFKSRVGCDVIVRSIRRRCNILGVYATKIQVKFFWSVMPCSFAIEYQCFGW